jgi:hypothetical protein
MNDTSVSLSTAPRRLALVSLPAAPGLVDTSPLLAWFGCSASALLGVPVVPLRSSHLPLLRHHWLALVPRPETGCFGQRFAPITLLLRVEPFLAPFAPITPCTCGASFQPSAFSLRSLWSLSTQMSAAEIILLLSVQLLAVWPFAL